MKSQRPLHSLSRPPAIAAFVGLIAGSVSTANAQVYYPKRGVADQSTGYLESKIGSNWYRGSGVIARDPRLIFSCGHLFYENGVWATQYEFYRAYHGSIYPDPGDGANPRGFRYFTSYASNANAYGSNSSRAFAYDFTVFYGDSPFGAAATCWPDGAAAVSSSLSKRIVGYPSDIEYTGQNGYCYQHATDWFPNDAVKIRDNYYDFDGVSTGEGNSGGPVFVMDASSGNYALGGMLVSGSYATAGVYALNSSSNTMASAALGVENVTAKFANNSSKVLADGTSSYTTRAVTASGFSGTVANLKCSVSITTKRRGDLDVYLVSPSGRVRWIKKHSTSTTDNLSISGADYSSTFAGYAANGTWKLKMRDFYSRNRATFNRFSVAVTAPAN
jgi:subtilisin-like proprotein convertase family protein